MGIPVRVFLNAKSGKGGAAESRAEIERLFAKHGCACAISRIGKGPKPSKLAKTDAAEMAYVAAGGDGTVSLVAGAVAGTGRRFGVLATGTLNHFAHDLGLPMELEPAIAAIAGGETRLVDAAEVNGAVFVNNSSLGFYPAMVVDRERMKKTGRDKWTALVAASLRAFVRFRCLTVEYEVGGEQRRCTTPFLFVGNNEYRLDGAGMGKRERLDGGRLCLYLAPGARRVTMLRFLAAAVVGRLKELPEFEELQPESFRVTTRRRSVRVSLDGEVRRMRVPLEYRARPGALTVLVPGETA